MINIKNTPYILSRKANSQLKIINEKPSSNSIIFIFGQERTCAINVINIILWEYMLSVLVVVWLSFCHWFCLASLWIFILFLSCLSLNIYSIFILLIFESLSYFYPAYRWIFILLIFASLSYFYLACLCIFILFFSWLSLHLCLIFVLTIFESLHLYLTFVLLSFASLSYFSIAYLRIFFLCLCLYLYFILVLSIIASLSSTILWHTVIHISSKFNMYINMNTVT